jgi:riboflavin biosynthesis pyrimidine reductase
MSTLRRLFPEPAADADPVDAYGRLTWVGDGHPAVRANMVASVDGAASAGGRSGSLGGPVDKLVFSALRSLADVILVGAGTMRTERYGPARLDEAARRRRLDQGLPAVPAIAVLTASCRLDWHLPFFTEAEERPLVVTVANAEADARARAAEVADVLLAGEDQVDMDRTLRALAERRHSNVLAEGGPRVLGQLADEGLLDELCLTLSPTLVAGDAGRIITGHDLEPMRRLELRDVLEADSYLFLRYGRPTPGDAGVDASEG